jgi:hypothetical protein
VVKNLKVIGVRTINGEKHYVVQSLECDEDLVNFRDFDEARMKKIMKKEASKPLLLLREE